MNDQPSKPTQPGDGPDDNNAWESAMSRDFDARVRDLHEAPLSLDDVKGKAVTVQRHRRIAVAGGVLAVAAVVTPVAVIAANGQDDAREPGFADNPTTTRSVTDPATTAPEYVLDGVWHQADGDEVPLAEQYDSAVRWGDRLVATRWDGEVYSVADVIDADGTVVDSFDTTEAVAVDEAGTTIAWVDTDGTVMTAWDGGETSLGVIDLAAAGETVAWSVAAVTGGPDCREEADGCVVYLNGGDGTATAYSSDGTVESPVPGATKFYDATQDGRVSVVDEVRDDLTACGGVFDLEAGDFAWHGCEVQPQQLSPSGEFVAAIPSQGDGLGPLSVSIHDAATGEETARWSPEGGFVGHWAWTGQDRLLFTAYDGASWHLFSLAPDGAAEEVADPVRGSDVDHPFLLVRQ